MEQTRAINALAPFVALSKSATSARAAADLVTQATSASNTYVFGELLQTPALQNLRNDAQYSNHYTLLELFAWGTWAQYQGRHYFFAPNTVLTLKLQPWLRHCPLSRHPNNTSCAC